MAELNVITHEEARAAAGTRCASLPRGSGAAGYFTDYVTERLVEELGPHLTFHGRLEVMTTLDPDVQRAAEEALAASGFQGAIVVLDGCRGTSWPWWGAATTGKASSTGPFTPAVSPDRPSSPSCTPRPWNATGRPTRCCGDEPRDDGGYRPANWDGRYRGPVTMGYALAHSLNAASVWLLSQIGPRAAVEMARRLGIDSVGGGDAHLALALGGLRHGVSPLRLGGGVHRVRHRGRFAPGPLHPPRAGTRRARVARARKDGLRCRPGCCRPTWPT